MEIKTTCAVSLLAETCLVFTCQQGHTMFRVFKGIKFFELSMELYLDILKSQGLPDNNEKLYNIYNYTYLALEEANRLLNVGDAEELKTLYQNCYTGRNNEKFVPTIMDVFPVKIDITHTTLFCHLLSLQKLCTKICKDGEDDLKTVYWLYMASMILGICIGFHREFLNPELSEHICLWTAYDLLNLNLPEEFLHKHLMIRTDKINTIIANLLKIIFNEDNVTIIKSQYDIKDLILACRNHLLYGNN